MEGSKGDGSPRKRVRIVLFKIRLGTLSAERNPLVPLTVLQGFQRIRNSALGEMPSHLFTPCYSD